MLSCLGCRRRFSAITRGVVVVLVVVSGCARSASKPESVNAARDGKAAEGVVATVHPQATQAGADVLRRGGNAVDAAVAAALMLGVVDGHNSGIGGGCFVLIRKADGTFLALDGRETAPAAVLPNTFLRDDGRADPSLSRTGALASGIPGSLAAYELALREAGTQSLAALLEPSAVRAEQGFTIDDSYARKLTETSKDLARFDASAAIFLDAQRRPWPRGHVLKQPDLARTYRSIARRGAGWFYGGPFANDVERWMAANGGLLTARDFADYRARPREPLVSRYRGHTIVGFPPPSSGGVHVAQVLNILQNFDLADLERRAPALRRHVVAEALKIAFADRAYWLGDPDFARVPRGLADEDYARQLSGRISLERATPVPSYGLPPRAKEDVFPGGGMLHPPHPSKHTTHIAAADAAGNWVAITTTVNTAFGSKVVIPGTGVVMNNQMDDFSSQAGVPNAFGLVGAEANAVEPGKRPLSSMSPTVVLDGDLATGRPVLTVGAAGGPTIISAVVQVIVNRLDLSMPIDRALAEPRLHHQWRPDVLVVERGMPQDVVDRLESLGHKVQRLDTIAAAQAAGPGDDGKLTAVHDPRVNATLTPAP